MFDASPNTDPLSNPAAAAEETKDDLRRRFDAQRVYMSSLKDDYERCQRKLLGAEMRIKELQTSSLIARNTAEDAKFEAAAMMDEARRTSAAAEARTNTAVERLRFAPQVDNSVRRLYCEVRCGCFELLGAAPIEDAEMQGLLKKGTLEIAEDCRLWTKWLFAAVEAQQQELQRLHEQVASASGEHTAAPLAATLAAAEDEPSSSSPDGVLMVKHQSSKRVKRRVAIDGDGAPHDSQANSFNLVGTQVVGFDDAVGEAMLKDQLKTAAVREDLLRERYERMADLARKDCAAAKQDVRNHLKTIKDLQAKLKKRDAVEVSALALERARREAVDTKKNMTVAVSAKQQELDTLRRELTAQIQLLLNENAQLKRQNDSVRVKESAIDDLKAAAKNAEAQLTRSGIQSSAAEIQRLKRLLSEKDDHCAALEQRQREQEVTCQRLKRDCEIATNSYNAIFAAHQVDAAERARTEAALHRTAVKQVIKTGALDVEMYKEQYKAARDEARRMKRQLLHLLVLTQKEGTAKAPDVRRSNATESADVSGTAASRLAVTHEGLGVIPEGSEFDYTVDPQSFDESRTRAMNMLKEASDMSGDEAEIDDFRCMVRDDSSPNTSAVLRIGDDAIVVDTKVPTFGAVNEYGNPFEPQGVVHVTASTPAPSLGEISIRAVQAIETKPCEATPSKRARRAPRATSTGSAKVAHDFQTLLSGEPRPTSAAALLTSIAHRRGLPLEGFAKQHAITRTPSAAAARRAAATPN